MKEAALFAQMVRTISAAGCAILVPKYASNFPTQGERLTGTIDIYWVRECCYYSKLLPQFRSCMMAAC